MELPFLGALVALGLGGGFLSGLLGLGGAIFMIPLLLYVPPVLGVGQSGRDRRYHRNHRS